MSNTFRFLSGHENWELGAYFVRRVDTWRYHVLETVPKVIGQPYEAVLWGVILNVSCVSAVDKHVLLVDMKEWRVTKRIDGSLMALGEDAVRALLVDRIVRSGAGFKLAGFIHHDFDEVRRQARLRSIQLGDDSFIRCPDCGETVCTEGCPGS